MKKISLILCLLFTIMVVGWGTADSVLRLPDSLTIIGVEAFAGDDSIDRVVLGENVTRIESRAFADSSLREINLPDSISFIADNAFDGPDKVSVKTNQGSYASDWANNNGYFSPVMIDQVVDAFDEDALYTQEEITWRVFAAGGTSPYKYQYSIYRNDSQIVSSSFISSNTYSFTPNTAGTYKLYITVKDSVGKTAQFNSRFVVQENLPIPSITSIAQDGTGLVSIEWESVGSEYSYTVFEQLKKGAVKKVVTTKEPYTSFIANSEGTHTYYIQAAKLGSDGYAAYSSDSDPESIDVCFIWDDDITIHSAQQTSDNAISLNWKGLYPVDEYQVAAKTGNRYDIINNAVISNEKAVIDIGTPGTYHLAVRAVYTDENGVQWKSAWSNAYPVVIASQEVYKPEAPELFFSEKAFSAQESTAPVYNQEDISVNWYQINNANTYKVTIEKKTGNTYTLVAEKNEIGSLNYVIEGSLFADLNTTTLYRFGISSQSGSATGDPAYSYFSVYVPSAGITVDGKNAVTWERSICHGTTRQFQVNSEREWTASSDVSWIKVSSYEKILEITLTENAKGATREGNVTLTNGKNSVVVHVAHGGASRGPEVSYFDELLSTDINNPTLIPAGDFKFDLGYYSSNKILFSAQKQNSNGTYGNAASQVYSNSQVTIPYNFGSLTFASGSIYKITVSGHFSSRSDYSAYEIEGDSPSTTYYIKTTNDNFVVLDEQNITIATDETIIVYASNAWHTTSDASWLTCEADNNDYSGGGRKYLFVTATTNTTGQERTGHITVSCGTKSAVLTVTQPDLTPRVVTPANLSQNESSPTVLDAGLFSFRMYGKSYKWEYKSNSSWVDGEDYNNFKEDCFSDECIGEDHFANNRVYRLTITGDNGSTNAYYVKRTSSVTSTIGIQLSSTTAWWDFEVKDKPAASSTETFKIKSSASWTAQSDVSWLNLDKTSGSSTSSQSLTLTISANTGSAERTGTISFKINSITRAQYIIHQIGQETEYINVLVGSAPAETNNDLSHASGSQNTYSIHVYSSSYPVTVTPSASWITCSNTTLKSINTSASINLAENTTSSARTGTITYSNGSVSKTINIRQEPLIALPSISSPSLSTSSSAPTEIAYNSDPISVSWSKAANATRYRISLVDYSADASDRTTYTWYVNDNNSSTYSCSIPASCFDPAYNGLYQLKLFAYDAYNNARSKKYYFTRSTGNYVFIDGKTSQSWTDVSDEVTSSDPFVIASSAGWTATASSNWITCSPASGNNGDSLVVNVKANSGSARTGTVTVKTGSVTATISVSQYAKLTDAPIISSPSLSQDITSPKAISKGNTLTAKWNREPQAYEYILELKNVVGNTSTRSIQKSDYLRSASTYSFDTSELEKGQEYCVQITRYLKSDYKVNRPAKTSSRYYFVYNPDEAYITLKSSSSRVDPTTFKFSAPGCEYSVNYHIKASGTFTVQVSDSSWMMVDEQEVTSEDLDRRGKTSSDYGRFISSDAEFFHVSLLDNKSGSNRTGTVTITTAGASKSFTVVQDQYYEKPEITSPVLGKSESQSVELLMAESVPLSWTSGENNTGEYDVILFEKDGNNYVKTYTKYYIHGLSHTIPASYIKADTQYKVRLVTTLSDGKKDVYSSYYFHTPSNESALAVSADVDWSRVVYGGDVRIYALATGGAGNYRFAYQLLKNGSVEQESTFGSETYYNFTPQSNGDYQIKVTVRDSKNVQATAIFNYTKTDTNVISVSVSNHYTATLDDERQNLEYTVISNGQWTLTGYPSWVVPSVEKGVSGNSIRLIINSNTGNVRQGVLNFRSSTGIESDLTITQSGANTSVIQGNDIGIQRDFSFTIGSNPVNVGIPVEFTVYSDENATAIRLVVDGFPYNEVLTSGTTTRYSRAFSQAGRRQVAFQQMIDGAWSNSCDVQELVVEQIDTLSAPKVTLPSVIVAGQDLRVEWETVPHADSYIVYFGIPGNLSAVDETTELYSIIPGSLIPFNGKYLVSVYAIGTNYGQSGTAKSFDAGIPDRDFMLVSPSSGDRFETHDKVYLKASNPNGRHLKFKVSTTKSDGTEEIWRFPSSGTISSPEPTYEMIPLTAGTYKVTVLSFANTEASLDSEAYDQTTEVSFTVISGTIGDRKVGSGYVNQDKTTVNNLVVQTSVGVRKLDVYWNNSLIKTLNYNTDSEVINYKRYWHYEGFDLTDNVAGVAEGSHTFYFVSTDQDGVKDGTDKTKKFSFFAYTPETSRTVYPQVDSLLMQIYPTYTTQSDKVLVLNEPLEVIGSYGSKYYVKTETGAKGYVNKGSVNSQKYVNWNALSLDVLSFRNEDNAPTLSVLSTNYTFTLNWRLNGGELPANAGYNVYLVPDDDAFGVSVKVNSSVVKTESLEVSASKLTQVYYNQDTSGYVRVKVDLIDTSSGAVKKSAISKGFFYLASSGNVSDSIHHLYVAMEHGFSMHDLLLRGEYTIDGEVTTGKSIKDVTGLGGFYAVVTGDASDLQVDPWTRAGMLADAIMKEVSSTKVDSPMSLKDVKNVLGYIGFDFDLMEYVDDKEYNSAKKMWETVNAESVKLNLKRDEHDREYLKKYLTAAFEKQDTKQLEKVFKNFGTVTKVCSKTLNIFEDYLSYQGVNRSDVQKYINSFKSVSGSSDDVLSLNLAASYLEILTSNEAAKIAFIACSYGGSWARDKLMDLGYDTALEFLPAEWKLAVKGASLFNNVTMNIKEIDAKAFELEAMLEMTEYAKVDAVNVYKKFEKNKSAANYDELDEKMRTYIGLHKLEMEKFEDFFNAFQDATVTKIINFIKSLWKEDVKTEIDVADLINNITSLFDDRMKCVYSLVIVPLNL